MTVSECGSFVLMADAKLHFQFVDASVIYLLVDLADVDNFRPIGWRGLISNHKEPFVGFGHCNSTLQVTIAELDKASKSYEDLVEFYMQTLRTYCDLKQKDQILKLVKDKHLEMNEDGTFSIHADSHLA